MKLAIMRGRGRLDIPSFELVIGHIVIILGNPKNIYVNENDSHVGATVSD